MLGFLKHIFPDTASAFKRLFSAFALTLCGMYALYPEGIFTKDYASDLRFAAVFVSTLIIFILLTLLRFTKGLGKYNTDSWVLMISSVFLSLWLCLASFRQNTGDINVFFVFAPLLALALYHTLYKDRLKLPGFSHKLWLIFVGASAAVMFFFTGVLMALRYYGLHCPSFDFGIFAQMFENMKDTLLPETTVERNYLLSHFAVHLSPANYLLLPFYLIYPHPVAVQLIQGAVITSGIVPVLLICRKRGMSKLLSAAVCAAFAFYPAFTGGVNYDFHENCMLVPFILWSFYAIERRSVLLTAVFSLLTLTVKEDAAVYVAVIGLYLLVSAADRKMRITGAALLACAVVWFAFACAILESMGLGIMSWRYSDYGTGSGGLLSVISTVVSDPAYVFSRLLTGEKLKFAAILLAPILFLPLASHRRPAGYLLLIPFILINLMPSYEYQYNIYFQYAFGSGAMLFYLFVINLSQLSYHTRRTAAGMAAAACAMMFLLTMTGMTNNMKTAAQYPERPAAVKYLESLEASEKSITADTFFIPPLYKQKQLYTINYVSGEPNEKNTVISDIVLLNRESANFDKYFRFFRSLGYAETPVDSPLASKLICRLEK